MLKRFKGFTLIELLIVVAIIAILAAIAVPNFLEAQTRSKVARVQADIRTIATGLETYYIDNNAYPAHDSSEDGQGYGVNNNPEVADDAPLRQIPTFRGQNVDVTVGDRQLLTMTTPVAYLTTLPKDPFADTKSAVFAYSVDRSKMGWIAWSYGPDGDEGVPQDETGCGGDIFIDEFNDVPTVSETTYDVRYPVPSSWLIAVTYDPTNGTSSNGDVFRTKQ